ncbi:hypothetical protein APHAL10511_000164 [Amanita phalloides]|nr:hypothetical protein APHAL10511_000164 [Amanita phalloides]
MLPSHLVLNPRRQLKSAFRNVAGLWQHGPPIVGGHHLRPPSRCRQPLKVTEIHRVFDIAPQGEDEYDDPLWLVRRNSLDANEQSENPVASRSSYTDRPSPDEWGAFFPQTKLNSAKIIILPKQHAGDQTENNQCYATPVIKPVAPLRIRRNQNRSESDVTRLRVAHQARRERLPHTQSVAKDSKKLAFDDVISPLQRMTNRLNALSTGAPPNEGARLRPGPSAHLPIVRKTTVPRSSPSQRLSESSATMCPPFPAISHPRIDLRCASLEAGYSRTRLNSSPAALGTSKLQKLPICREAAPADLNKVVRKR